MKINGLDVIGDETGPISYGHRNDNGEPLSACGVGPEIDALWWQHIHSASLAIEAARQILAEPYSLHTGELSAEMLFVCSELIFRVTGERVIPGGLAWYGKTLECGVCSFSFNG